MNKKETFFTDENLISQLISFRVKKAKSNHDLFISQSYLQSKKKETEKDIIYSIMPPRKKWIKLGQEYRKKGKLYLNNSVKVNKKRLQITIEKDSKKLFKPRYLKNLKKFIRKQKRRLIFYKILKISKPNVIPIPKDAHTLRPLCSFHFEDNLILKEVNSFLTKKFDVLFLDCSYAFRAKNINNHVPTHHDTIEKILEYLRNHNGEQIYVAECDLQKFFDTINHKVIRNNFEKAINDKRVSISQKNKNKIKKIVDEYLNSYNFIENVKAKEQEPEFINKYGNKTFKWIKENELISCYGLHYHEEKLGIPQGGPLSGLFANLVQNSVDEAISKLNDHNLLYLRYCDDMIMLHTNKDKLDIAFNLYQEKIKENKLFVHSPKEIDNKWYSKKFYDEKSKSPYKWGPAKLKQIPWISFVGYQIHYSGEVRVRKSSIKKEQTKQYKIVNKTIGDIKKYGIQKSPKEIKESVSKRLIGMSVGRIFLYDVKEESSLCWSYGFSQLNKNNFSLNEMRLLDRSRKKAYGELCKFLNTLPRKEKSIEEIEDENYDRPIIYSGKAYSYYSWLENKGSGDEKKLNTTIKY